MLTQEMGKSDPDISIPTHYAAHRGFPIWLRLVAQKVVREFRIESAKEEFETEFVVLRNGDDTFAALVGDNQQLGNTKSVMAFLEFMVHGVHLHTGSRLKRALLGAPFCRQKGHREGFVQFRGLVREVLQAETSSISISTGKILRLSFSAVVEVGNGFPILLTAIDTPLSEIAVGDILEGDAVATLRLCTSAGPINPIIPDSLQSLWSALR